MNNINLTAYNLVIFGAKGDLSCRKLIPALYQLENKKLLHHNTQIIGVGRALWSQYNYILQTKKTLKKFHSKNLNMKYWNKFKSRLHFCNLDVYNINDFYNLKNILSLTSNVNIYYFAMPPSTFGKICEKLGKIQLNHQPNRIIVEKPIGLSYETSKIINNKLNIYFQENQIFRIDHYLGKETILNLLSLRFANPLFYHNWNKHVIDHVEILIAEQVGIEGRWEYFNAVGQTRDMIQNHLLQILSLITMSTPKNLNADSIKNEKIKILKSLRTINSKNIYTHTTIGQYTSGIINGKKVSSYLEETGIKKNSNTETFTALTVYIDNDQWFNVPFYLRTGKRLFEKKSEITIYFKNINNNIFFNKDNQNYQNKLKINLQPHEGLEISFFNKTPDLNYKYLLQEKKMYFKYKEQFKKYNIPDAYEKLLLDSMNNDQSLFVSKDEIELSWKWIDTIINTWKKYNIKPIIYSAGTWGPSNKK